MAPIERRMTDLIAEDAFVRRLARRVVMDAATADDVAQDAFVAALAKEPPQGAPIRGWLTVILRRLASRMQRGARRRARREAVVARPEAVDSAAEIVARENERRRLVEAVLALPEIHRTVVLRRYFDGESPRAIAAALGVPLETVRTRLKTAHEKLRSALGGDSRGEPMAFGALIPLVCPTAASKVSALGHVLVARAWHGAGAALWEAASMTVRTKVLAAASVLFVIVGGWALFRSAQSDSHLPAGMGASETAPAPGLLTGSHATSRPSPAATRPSTRMSAVPFQERAVDGVVDILVRHRARGMRDTMLTVYGMDHGHPMLSPVRRRTDDSGRVRLEGIHEGRIWAVTDSGWGSEAKVVAGTTTSVTIDVGDGFTLVGRVVDDADHAIADADVLLGRMLERFTEPCSLKSDSAGRFTVENVCERILVAARAAGMTPSSAVEVMGAVGDRREVTLRLSGKAGGVEGRVVDSRGVPVVGAVVIVSSEGPTGIAARRKGGPEQGTPPFATSTDALGHFRMGTAEPGLRRVQARGPKTGAVETTIQVDAGRTSQVELVLPDGVSLEGRVLTAAGVPLARASVTVGMPDSIWGASTRSGDDGAYRLDGLNAGSIDVTVHHDGEGDAAQSFRDVTDGTNLHWDAQLSQGVALKIRVVDETQRPLAGASLSGVLKLWAPGVAQERMSAYGKTDADGRAVFPNKCDHKIYRMTVNVRKGNQIADRTVELEPDDQEHVIVIRSSDFASCLITGRLIREDGSVVPSATLVAGNVREDGESEELSDVSGRFRLGPYRAGRLYVRVKASGFGTVLLGEREVATGDTWDLGDVMLAPPGSLVVTFATPPTAKPSYMVEILGLGSFHTEFATTSDGVARATLQPGRYAVRMHGSNPAGIDVDRVVTIESGRVTQLEIPIVEGVRRDVRVKSPVLPTYHDPLNVRVIDATGAQVCERAIRGLAGGDDIPMVSLTLKPGRYRVTSAYAGAKGETAFEILEDETTSTSPPTPPIVDLVLEDSRGK